MIHTQVVFFIPGRIRIKLSDHLSDEKAVCGISSTVEDALGVISARLNNRTNNLLVCYDPELIDDKKIIGIINADMKENGLPSFSEKQSYAAVFQNERKLSGRWVRAVLLTGGIISAINFIFSRLISIFILACPFFIFTAPAATFYYAARRSESRRLFIRNKRAVRLLEKVKSVYISDSMFFLSSQNDSDAIIDFVFGIRENGITDIAVLMEQNHPDINRMASMLEIGKIFYINDKTELFKFCNEHSLLIITEDHQRLSAEPSDGLILHIFDKNFKEIPSSDLIVQLKDIYKIPWLLGFSHYCREIIIRCQNIAITLSTLALLAVSLGYIGPLGALAAYGFNVAWQPIFIKNKILSYTKEISNGG